MRTTSLLALALLSRAAFVFADAGTTIAALPNEKAEARYLNQLCKTVQTEFVKYKTATDAGTAAAARFRATGDTSDTSLTTALAEATVHRGLLNQALDDLKQATEVAKAKRGRLPKGYTEPCKWPGVDD